VAAAVAVPIDDTEEVAAAKAQFQAAFDSAAAGGLAAAQAPQIAAEYLADNEDVREAKAAFYAAFDDATAGGLAAKQAPAPQHVIPAPAPLVAPLSYAMPYAYAAGMPYTYAAGMPYTYAAGMPYTYAAGMPYAYAAGMPYAYAGLPVVQVAAATETKA
jgi:hypothetical protein